MALDNGDLDVPSRSANPQLLSVFLAHAEAALDVLDMPDTLSGRVLREIIDRRGGEAPTMPTVAKALAMSPRHVQRGLSSEGTTFQALLDDARRELAVRHLAAPDATVAKVAWLVGFSGLIGATHNDTYSLFNEGMMPTPGLERLSEEGKHDPLDAEIRAALAAGSVGALVETGPLRDFGDSLVTTVRVNSTHPMVSLVAMIAPSPDWFAGVRSVNLMENGAWVESRTLELRAYDSGGDDGTITITKVAGAM